MEEQKELKDDALSEHESLPPAGDAVTAEDEAPSQDIRTALRSLRKFSKRGFGKSQRFQSASEVRRQKWLKSQSRAKRNQISIFLGKMRQREEERGYFARRSRTLRIKTWESYERGERRSIVVVNLNIEGESAPLWLMLEKKDRRTGKRFLTWPGGKAESAGEHPIQTAIREVWEETGLDLSSRINALERRGAMESPGEYGGTDVVDVFRCCTRITRAEKQQLHCRSHHVLMLLDDRRFTEEMRKPGRVSHNAIRCLRIVAGLE